MPYTFKFHFLGLCAFVPSEPIEIDTFPEVIDHLTVLVPSLLYPRQLSDTIMLPHYPSLQYQVNQRLSGDKPVRLVVPKDGATVPEDMGLCFLEGEDLTVSAESSDTGKLHLVNGHVGGGATAPVPGKNDHSVFWMAHMEHAATGAGTLAPGLVPPAKPSKKILLGRVLLESGTLTTAETVEAVTEFDQGSSYKQQIAKQLTWQLTGVKGPVTITFTGFQGEGGTKLVLQPKDDQVLVEVTLRNLEIDAFMKEFQGGPKRQRGSDFEIYYGLADEPPARTPAPVFPKPPHDGVHELCPPGLFRHVAIS
jgi:hypothetical protein